MKNALLFSLLLLLGIYSCKKDTTPVIPPDTNAQGEYFNCKIDGKYWTYKQSGYTNHDALTAGKGIITDLGYAISGTNVVDFPQTVVTFWMIGTDFPDSDTIELADYSSGNYVQVNNPPPAELSSVEFSSDSLHTGRLIFTKRSPQRLEGTFQFNVYRIELNRVVRFTEGRFSIIP